MGTRETARRRGVAGAAATLLTVGLMAGCADDTSRRPSDDVAASPSPSRSSAPPVSTPELDSIAVIGHSGATGANSDPDKPGTDARENSWATGDNPAVRSIYLRLLATHHALAGHAFNEALDGSDASSLPDQASLAMQHDPVPDLVLIQSVDNDVRCDGTDRQNQEPYAASLGGVIRSVVDASRHTQVFLVSPWATAANYAAAVKDDPEATSQMAGSGPCDLFDERGRPRPAGIRREQALYDMYWATAVRTCHRIPRCFTDGGVERRLVPEPRDITYDFMHLTPSGHRKFAELAWSALPAAIGERP
jgi:hypothetical protein